jgi:hypothetical protein
MWEERRPGKGSVVYADGRLYCRNEGREGTVYLVDADPKGYVERGRFNPPDRSKEQAWPHPVVANGKLYIRDQDVLLCYDGRPSSAARKPGRAADGPAGAGVDARRPMICTHDRDTPRPRSG